MAKGFAWISLETGRPHIATPRMPFSSATATDSFWPRTGFECRCSFATKALASRRPIGWSSSAITSGRVEQGAQMPLHLGAPQRRFRRTEAGRLGSRPPPRPPHQPANERRVQPPAPKDMRGPLRR